MSRCDRYIAICGDHWFDTLDRSFLAPFRDKTVHVNMALDTADYPLVKQEFNPSGKRRFFYIGRHAPEKGADLLEELAAAIPGFEGGYICPGKELAGWHRISPPRKLTPEFMQRVAAGYDIFINMSRADAQATTILEAMSWGFPVACTPESGYGNDDFFYLDLHDRERNMAMIRADSADEGRGSSRDGPKKPAGGVRKVWMGHLCSAGRGVCNRSLNTPRFSKAVRSSHPAASPRGGVAALRRTRRLARTAARWLFFNNLLRN